MCKVQVHAIGLLGFNTDEEADAYVNANTTEKLRTLMRWVAWKEFERLNVGISSTVITPCNELLIITADDDKQAIMRHLGSATVIEIAGMPETVEYVARRSNNDS